MKTLTILLVAVLYLGLGTQAAKAQDHVEHDQQMQERVTEMMEMMEDEDMRAMMMQHMADRPQLQRSMMHGMMQGMMQGMMHGMMNGMMHGMMQGCPMMQGDHDHEGDPDDGSEDHEDHH